MLNKIDFLSSLILAVIVVSTASLMADYPVASHRYLADPSSLVAKDRVYIYCSDDDESPVQGSYNIPDVVCISSSDMKNWTDHGSVFRASTETKWAKKTWAPAAIERDGKYFLYFGNGGGNIGVVVSTNPVGPFRDVRGRDLINHNTPGVQPAKNMWLFDPGVFIDDDGQAYIYFGGNGDDNVRCAKLNRDMITLDGDIIKMNATNFFEASWVFKRNGKYYFSYSTTPKAQMRIDYLIGNSPTNFAYRGVVAEQPPINNNNNHAAQFEFNGHWYHVYHNRIVAKQAGIPTGYRRNIAIEEFSFNDDGSIKKVAYTTNGVAQLGHLNPYARVEGETFNAQSGIKTEPCSEGGMNLTDIHNGDWIRIVGVDFGERGAEKFTARVASAEPGGNIELRLGGVDGRLIGTCKVEKTGGWQQWKTVSSDVSGAAGVQDLYLKFTGSDKDLFNLDYWKFERSGVETPQPAASSILLASGTNPIFRDAFTADPAPIVVGDTLFVHVGHDEAKDGEMFTMHEWLCYSTKDMTNWQAHGPVMRATDFKWARGDAWASQAVEKNGKFYFYTTVTHDQTSPGRAIGVAVADSPLGPFKDARGTALVTDATTPSDKPWNDIDPTVFIDDDGQAYMAWGNPYPYFVRLKPNMVELDGEIQRLDLPNYTEGPWLHKHRDTYYLTYAAFAHQGTSEKICYATAPKITGPWTYRGILTGFAKNSFTIHPGIVEFKGQSYLFYHNATLKLNGRGGALGRRSVCVEPLYYNPDGTIQPVTQTVEGVTLRPQK